MLPLLHCEPLRDDHLAELAPVLLQPAVYEHIEASVPGIEAFTVGLQRAIHGPGPSRPDERWFNFLVRDAGNAMVGRLEATVHHGLAEVAFLFGPQHWGRGLAQAGLLWLRDELIRSTGVVDFWATTVPANTRCQRLLQRCGYEPSGLPPNALYSYDPGDLVFRHRRVP